MRILLQTVGTGDAGDVWEALARVLAERNPDLAVALCSIASLERTVPKAEAAARTAGWSGTLRSHVGAHHEDIGGLAAEYCELVDDLLREFPGADIEVDFTSGTKPMSAAAVLAATARPTTLLHYARGVRDPDTPSRVVGTAQVESLSTRRVAAGRQLDELGRLFDLGQYVAAAESAAELARALAPDPAAASDHAKAESLAAMARVCHDWDRFRWGEAARSLGSFMRGGALPSAGWDLEQLRRIRRHLLKCQENRATPGRMADLLANAGRCLTRGRWDDGVARLYRLLEYVAQRRASLLGLSADAKDILLEQLEEIAPRTAAKLRERSPHRKRLNLGLEDLINVGSEAGDSVAIALANWWQEGAVISSGRTKGLSKLRDQRNSSFLAHGQTPIDEASARQLYEAVAAAVSLALASEGAGEITETTVHFPRCPWTGRQ